MIGGGRNSKGRIVGLELFCDFIMTFVRHGLVPCATLSQRIASGLGPRAHPEFRYFDISIYDVSRNRYPSHHILWYSEYNTTDK